MKEGTLRISLILSSVYFPTFLVYVLRHFPNKIVEPELLEFSGKVSKSKGVEALDLRSPRLESTPSKNKRKPTKFTIPAQTS